MGYRPASEIVSFRGLPWRPAEPPRRTAPAGDPGWRENDTEALARGSPAIHSALADYLPCSFKGDLCYGRAAAPVLRSLWKEFNTECVRNLRNDRNVASLGPLTNPQQAGEVWAGAFWELRDTEGAP